MVFKSKYPDVKPDPKYQDLVSNFFWSQLDKFKRNVLFVDYATQRHWTGAQIKSTSARLARNLIKHGFKANDDCVMFYKHCDYIQVAALGVLFAGGSVCAGYDLDPEQEHAYMLNVVKPKFVFVSHELVDEMLRVRSADHHNYTIVIMDDDEDSLDELKFRTLTRKDTMTANGADKEDQHRKQQVGGVVIGLHHDLLSIVTDDDLPANTPLPVQVDPQRPAFILLTSGSTGHPKPVSRSQRNSLYVCHSLASGAKELWDLNESSVVAAHLALDHGTGIFLLKHCLTEGFKSIIINGYQLESMLDAIQKHRISDLVLGSALVHNLLNSDQVNEALSKPAAASGLDSLRNLIPVGSSIASQSLVSQFMNRLPECSVRQAFGMTETGFLCIVPRELALRQHKIAQNIVGCAMPNVEFKLMSRQPGQQANGHNVDEVTQLDQTGELYVRGPTVSPGYCGDQFRKQTSEVFLSDGFYKSNDICSIGSDGMLRVHGRFSEVLCLGDGWKILPSEIEHVIMEHPLVREAAVVGVPHPKLPTCHAPRAYVVPRDGVEIDDDDDSVNELFVVVETGSNELSSKKQNGSSNNNNNNTHPQNNRNKPDATGQCKTISRRSIFKFVADRVSEPKYLVGGIKFMPSLPRISIGKVDKRSLKAADGF